MPLEATRVNKLSSCNLTCVCMHIMQIPWGRWGGGALVVELEDVTLEVTSRDDTDWEEGPALRRAQAAKQAQLAAAELAKLGSRVAAEGHKQQEQSASSSKGGTRWSIVDYITSYLLNRLQLTVTNVHVCFKVGDLICWVWDIMHFL